MSKQSQWQTRELRRQVFVNDERVINQQLPAILVGEIRLCVAVPTVATMVVDSNDETPCHSRLGESRIALPMLTKAMGNLDDTDGNIVRRPVPNMYRVPIVGCQCQVRI